MQDHGRIKRRCLPVLLAILVLGPSLWCGLAAGQSDRKPLWSISSGGNQVYLLGSIHLLSRWDYPLDPDFERAYRDSRVIVFETDLEAMDQPETRALMVQHSLLPKGGHIREVLSPGTFRMLAGHLEREGLDMIRFEGLRPWVCALTLTMLELGKRGYLPEFGLDRYFYQSARQDRKTIVPLEPAGEQLALFFELNQTEQDAFLKRTLTDLGMVDTLFPEMLALWKSGRLDRLDKVMQKSFAGHPALYEKFLVRRNQKWLPVIEGLIGKPENALVIVGASHLGGKDGLIRMLTDRGYRVVQR